MTTRHAGPPLRPASILLEPGFWENARLTWRLTRDARVAPVLKMIVPFAILLYVLSPIDLIPDFLLGLGQLDDLGVLTAALLIGIRLLPRLAPNDILAEHLAAMGVAPDDAMHRPFPIPGNQQYVDATYRVHDTPADNRAR